MAEEATKLSDVETAAARKVARTLHRIEMSKADASASAETINAKWAEQRGDFLPLGRRVVRALKKSGLNLSK